MALWSDFYSRLLPRVKGCPEPLASAELRNAADEFFRRTRAWREWCDPVTLSTSREYDLDPPVGAYVVRIECATLDGRPFPVDGSFELGANPTMFDAGDGLSSADRATFVMSRTPMAGARLGIQLSLAPKDGCTGIPDHLRTQYADALLDGALARIRTISGYEFSDDARAAVDMAKFEKEIGRVSGLVYRSNSNTMPARRVGWC